MKTRQKTKKSVVITLAEPETTRERHRTTRVFILVALEALDELKEAVAFIVLSREELEKPGEASATRL